MAAQQQQWWPNNGNNCGYGAARKYCTCTNGSGFGICGDGNSIYFAINLHTMAMTVAITAPTVEAAAL